MSGLFRSKVGMLLAGVYLVLVLFCLAYINFIESNSPPLLLLMVLIAPWFYLITVMSYMAGLGIEREVLGSKNFDYAAATDIVILVISVVINMSILYLVGYLLTKAFRLISPSKD